MKYFTKHSVTHLQIEHAKPLIQIAEIHLFSPESLALFSLEPKLVMA